MGKFQQIRIYLPVDEDAPNQPQSYEPLLLFCERNLLRQTKVSIPQSSISPYSRVECSEYHRDSLPIRSILKEGVLVGAKVEKKLFYWHAQYSVDEDLFGAAIDQTRAALRVLLLEGLQRADLFAIDFFAVFHFKDEEMRGTVDDEVDLYPAPRSSKIELGLALRIGDPRPQVLRDAPFQSMPIDLLPPIQRTLGSEGSINTGVVSLLALFANTGSLKESKRSSRISM
jgi:hypothetical protein